jgi:hypothetical protein
MLEELNIVEDDNALEEFDKMIDIEDDDEDDDEEATSENENEEAEPKEKETDTGLDGKYWQTDGQAGYCLSVIKGFGNLEATHSTPKYGFEKGLSIFGGLGYDATVKELDENLIGRDVIKILPPQSVTCMTCSRCL